MRSPRWEDYNYMYIDELEGRVDEAHANGLGSRKKANRLAWLGNGWSQMQIDERDLAFYLYPEFLDRPVAPRPEEKGEYGVRAFSY
jgi:hypothetical protein